MGSPRGSVLVTTGLAVAQLFTGGCNWVFDLDEAVLVSDEPPVNAVCPPIGQGPPRFRSSAQQILSRGCYVYTVSPAANLAVAACIVPNQATIEEGPIDGPLMPMQIEPSVPGALLDRPAIAPEGDHLVIRQVDPGPQGSPAVQHAAWYARAGAGWVWQADIATATSFMTAGAPSAGPERRVIVWTVSGFEERAQQPDGTWSVRFSGTPAELGATPPASNYHLSPDALRLTFVAGSSTSPSVMYAERSSRDEPFGTATVLDTVGGAQSAFLLGDCSKIYLTGLGSVSFRYQE